MWDLHRPGIEPVSPALAGRFLSAAPPGKPAYASLCDVNTLWVILSLQCGVTGFRVGKGCIQLVLKNQFEPTLADHWPCPINTKIPGFVYH